MLSHQCAWLRETSARQRIGEKWLLRGSAESDRKLFPKVFQKAPNGIRTWLNFMNFPGRVPMFPPTAIKIPKKRQCFLWTSSVITKLISFLWDCMTLSKSKYQSIALMIFSCLTNNKHDENTDLVQNADMRLPITNHVRLFCYLFA